jgi:hypothetical protein
MLSSLASSLRSLAVAPAAVALDQAHRMARRRLSVGGAAREPRSGDPEPADFVLPADVDASALAATIREKLGMAGGGHALHPLEQRKLGGSCCRPWHSHPTIGGWSV